MAFQKSPAFIFTFFLAQALFFVAAAFAQIDENFDSLTLPNLPAAWVSAKTGAGSGWKSVATNSSSPSNSVFAADINTSATSTLTTPAFIFDGNHVLSFQHSYDLEAPPIPFETAYDGGVLEVKVGAGLFTDISVAPGFFSTCPYDRTIDGFQNPLVGRRAWSGTISSFKNCAVFIPSSATGQQVQFRWILATDASIAKIGWWIDDVKLQVAPNIAISEQESPSPAVAGQQITYITTATNTSNLTTTVKFAKILPRSSSFVSVVASDSAATINSGLSESLVQEVTAEFSNVGPGQSVTLTSVVRLKNPVGGDAILTVNSPAFVAGEMIGRPALFGSALTPGGVTGNLAFATDSIVPAQDGCDALTNGPALSGKIAILLYANVCSAQLAALNVQSAGAIGVVFVVNGQELADLPSSLVTPVTIPALVVSQNSGFGLFFSILLFNSTPNVTISSPSGVIGSSAAVGVGNDSDWSNNLASIFTTVLPDGDGDGVADSNDQCLSDPGKSIPGSCGCGVSDIDSNSNEVPDCLFTKDLKTQVGRAVSSLKKLVSSPTSKKAKGKNTQIRSSLQTLLSQISTIAQAGAANIQLKSNKASLTKLNNSVVSRLGKALKLRKASFGADKKNALAALTKLSKALNA